MQNFIVLFHSHQHQQQDFDTVLILKYNFWSYQCPIPWYCGKLFIFWVCVALSMLDQCEWHDGRKSLNLQTSFWLTHPSLLRLPNPKCALLYACVLLWHVALKLYEFNRFWSSLFQVHHCYPNVHWSRLKSAAYQVDIFTSMLANSCTKEPLLNHFCYLEWFCKLQWFWH